MQVNISVKLPNLCRSVFRDMGISACEMAAAFGESCRCEYGKKQTHVNESMRADTVKNIQSLMLVCFKRSW